MSGASFDPNALPIPDLGLRCLGCGYLLAGLPRHRCPECGRPIELDEHIPKGDYPVVIYDGREQEITSDVADLLRSAQIPFMDVVGASESMFGNWGLTHSRSRLAVPRSTYFRVIHLLHRFFRYGERPPLVRGTGHDWTCSVCGESNPGNFEVCWNCGK